MFSLITYIPLILNYTLVLSVILILSLSVFVVFLCTEVLLFKIGNGHVFTYLILFFIISSILTIQLEVVLTLAFHHVLLNIWFHLTTLGDKCVLVDDLDIVVTVLVESDVVSREEGVF